MREWLRFSEDNSSPGIGGSSNDGGASSPNDPAPGMGGQGDPHPAYCASCSVRTVNHYCPHCAAHYMGPGVEHKKKKKHLPTV